MQSCCRKKDDLHCSQAGNQLKIFGQSNHCTPLNAKWSGGSCTKHFPPLQTPTAQCEMRGSVQVRSGGQWLALSHMFNHKIKLLTSNRFSKRYRCEPIWLLPQCVLCVSVAYIPTEKMLWFVGSANQWVNLNWYTMLSRSWQTTFDCCIMDGSPFLFVQSAVHHFHPIAEIRRRAFISSFALLTSSLTSFSFWASFGGNFPSLHS